MTVSFVPLAGRVYRRIAGWTELEDSAERVVQVNPAERFPMPEAMFLPGQLDRITGTHSLTGTIGDEVRMTLDPVLPNTESFAFLVRNAVVGQGRVSTWTGYRDLSHHHAGGAVLRLGERVAEAALCSTWQGNDYFAHFLFDDAAIHPLAARFADPFFSGASQPRTAHCRDYLAKFGFDYVEKENIRVGQLWMFRDFALGPDKRARLRGMVEAVQAATVAPDPKPGAFIRRGTSGQVRVLENAAEVEAWCVAQGFVIVDPERQSVEEICAALKDVPLVIGVEGSHLVHALFTMARGGTILCIQPADRYNVIFRQLGAAMDLNWGFVVADGTVEGFRLDLGELSATVDLVQARRAGERWI